MQATLGSEEGYARWRDFFAQGEVKAILEEAAGQATNAEIEAILDRWQRYWQQQGKTFSDSAELIREDRDSR